MITYLFSILLLCFFVAPTEGQIPLQLGSNTTNVGGSTTPVYFRFVLNPGSGLRCTFTCISLEAGDDSQTTNFINFQLSDGTLISFSGPQGSPPTCANTFVFALSNGSVTVQAYSQSAHGHTFLASFSYTCGPDVSSLPALPLNVTKQLSNSTGLGGFIYLRTQPLVDGTSLYFRSRVYNYKGLREPYFFIGKDNKPTLEKYDYTNTTIKGSNYSVFEYTINAPSRTSIYVLGIFLSGRYSYYDVLYIWKYNYPVWPQDQVLQGSATRTCGQFYTPPELQSITLEFSRAPPGGNPILVIKQGYGPSLTDYDYKIDTSQGSFQTVDIAHPYDPDNQNPGMWYGCVISPTSSSVGYLVRWSEGGQNFEKKLIAFNQ